MDLQLGIRLGLKRTRESRCGRRVLDLIERPRSQLAHYRLWVLEHSNECSGRTVRLDVADRPHRTRAGSLVRIVERGNECIERIFVTDLTQCPCRGRAHPELGVR